MALQDDNFRDFLAKRYRNRKMIISFIELPKIKLDEAELPDGLSARELWHAVLCLTKQINTFAALIAEVRREYEKDAALINELAEAWLKGKESAPVAIDMRNPYPGLRPFEEKESEQFFGRERWIKALTESLDQHGFVTLYGGSGSGKSSLIRAGLMPRLRKAGQEAILFTPGKNPFDSLLAMGLGNRPQAQSLIDSAQKGQLPGLFAELAAKCFPGKTLLIVLDQGEELYTRCERPEVREAFLECLFHARSQSPRILIGIREDFFDRWNKTRAHDPDFGATNLSLTAPDEDDWRAIILEPARNHGVIFQAGLPEVMIERLRDARSPLPLLQFLLQKLWDYDKPEDGVLNRESYDSLGGVDNALRGHVVAFIARYPSRESEIRQMLFKLVRFTRQDGQYRALSRSCPVKDLPKDLADALVGDEWRLLTTRGQAGEVELSHEVILRVWPGFEKLEQERGALHALKSDITEATARWLPTKQKSELWAGSRLEESLRLAGLPGLVDDATTSDDFAAAETPLSDTEREFLETSRAKVLADLKFRKQLLQAATTTAGIMLLLAVGAGLFWWDSNEQKAKVVQANEMNLRNLHDASMADYAVAVKRIEKENKWHEGVAHLVRALKWEPSNPIAAARLYSTLSFHAPEKQTWPREILSHGDVVASAHFSPDGTRIVTASADDTAQVWDADTGKPLGMSLKHDFNVNSAEFSPDGTRIVTTNDGSTARIWDATTGSQLGQALVHDGCVHRAEFSPDGTRIVTSSDDSTAQIWDAATGNSLGTLKHTNATVDTAHFSPDGTRIVTASRDKTAAVWDSATGHSLAKFQEHNDWVNSAQFSPDGTRIVTASRDKTARIWDAATGEALGKALEHNGDVTSAQFSPDGTRIVTSSTDKTARIWDATTGEALAKALEHSGDVTSAQFSPDGTRIVTSSTDKTARIWDAVTGDALGEFLQHEAAVRSAQFSPDGTLVVTAIGHNKDWGKALIWDAATGQALGDPLRHDNWVGSVQFSPNGTLILTSSLDRPVRIWDVATGLGLSGPTKDIRSAGIAQFSPDGNRIVTTSNDKTAQVWDMANGHPLGEPLKHEDWANSAQFSPDGTRIVTACGMFGTPGIVLVWDAATGKPRKFLDYEQGVMSAQFSPDGASIVTASADQTARVWDSATSDELGKPLSHQDGLSSAQFSPDGTRIVTASKDKTAQVWDAATSNKLGKPLKHEDWVNSAQFSPDGTRVVTASNDKTARVWDVATGQVLGEPLRHEDLVISAQFSPDGSRIVTASRDKTARLWDAASLNRLPLPVPESMLARASALAGLRFTPDGELEAVDVKERFATLQEPISGDDRWSALARWLVLPSAERTITPDSRFTRRQIAERERDTLLREGLESAIRYDPSVPLARLLLAKFEEKPQRAAFLRDYDLKRLPADAALWARASKSLLEQQQPKQALEAAKKAVSLDPNLPAAKKALAQATGLQK